MKTSTTQSGVGTSRQFKLISCLGTGGFGEVYLCEMSTSSGFTKTVALKIMRADVQQSDDTAQRMRDEAKLLGMMRHRTIVGADDLITVAGRPAVVMEYVPGVNHSWIIHPRHNPSPIPPRVILGVISSVADALDVAFNRPSTVTGQPLNVLHRDIKPANIRVTPDGEVKLLDFGIARAEAKTVEREAHTTEYQLGSLPYMAPELMDGSSASPATDIYSLGVTLYESLARKRFGWAGESQDMHQNQIDTRISELDISNWEGITDDVIEMTRLMLAYDPEERPTAKEVSEACRELARTSPGVSIEVWANDSLTQKGVGNDGDKDKGELTGETLFEDVGASGGQRAADLDSLDEETIAYPMGGTNSKQDQPKESQPRLIIIALGLVVILMGVFANSQRQQQLSSEEAATRAVEAVLERQAEEAAALRESEALAAEEAAAEEALLETQTPEEEPTIGTGNAVEAAQPASPAVPQPVTSPPDSQEVVEEEQVPVGPPVPIRILSQPMDIEVLVDGNPVGRTPIRDLELSQGEHIITFIDGENSLRETITVTEGGKDRWKYLQAGHTVQ